PSSFPAKINPRILPMGRTRLHEIAKRVSGGRLLGPRRVGPRTKFSEAIRAGIEGEPFRICPAHDQLQCALGQARRVTSKNKDRPLLARNPLPSERITRLNSNHSSIRLV